jgi:CSLREA domain-containing protein
MPHPRARRLLGAPGRRRASRPLAIEPLEGRRLLAALVVNTTADENDPANGTLSLREAIEISNGTLAISSLSAQEQSLVLGALSSPNEIDFAIPNPANTLQTIFLTTPLPAISSPLNINGETEPGFVPNLTSFPNVNENETDVEVPMIRVDGSLIDRTLYPDANGLTINTVNCGVSSLSITGFSGAGIDLEPGPGPDVGAIGSTILSNFIGITSFDSTTNSTVVDPATNPYANGAGIVVRSSNNRIGSTLPVGRNVIRGNTGDGVLLQNAPGAGNLGTGNRVEGDYILDNGAAGVRIENSNNYIGETIGSGPAGGGNIISGNGTYGILIVGLPSQSNASQNNPAQGNVIVNNEIGTNYGIAGLVTPKRGMSARPNRLDGIFIEDSPGNIVGGLTPNSKNVIAGNGRDGVSIQNASIDAPFTPPTNPNVQVFNSDDNTVQGNWIGFNNRSSTVAYLPNRDGVNISSSGNVIGGTDPAAQNIIINNSRNGVTISGMVLDANNNDLSAIPNARPKNNVIQGNFIGTQGGADYFDNTLAGVLIDGGTDNTIGGTAQGAANVISGNNNGVEIRNPTSTRNAVQGNLIGTMSDGVTILGNAIAGVWVLDSPGNLIGGTSAGAANVISGNNDGVILDGANATGNLVQGNFIGTDIKGTTPIRNAVDGVLITNNASGNTIGGTGTIAGNTIANNIGAGVDVVSGTGNAILSNSMFANHRIGIDLVGPNDTPLGVTPNHATSPTPGPNDFQNYPVLASAVTNGTSTSIQGTLRSTPVTTFTIQLFSSPQPQSSGYGEGKTLLGSITVETDANGDAPITINFPAAVPIGSYITATATVVGATGQSGSTSEFSQAIAAASPSAGNLPATFLVTNVRDSGPGSLRQAILDANNNVGRDTIVFAIPQTPGQPAVVQKISLFSPLPAITDPVIIDGYTEMGSAANPSDDADVDVANLMVQIDGLVAGVGATGLAIQAANCNVSGLIITGFSGPGIAISGVGSQGNWIYGNFIGALSDPTSGRNFPVGPGNGVATNQPGILITSSNNRVGGNNPSLRNVIVGNGIGVEIATSTGTGNLLQGNFILDNAQQGVLVTSSNNTIGEALKGGGNYISGNGQQGVEITGGPPSQGNLVVGNFIGTDIGTLTGVTVQPAGMTPRPNQAQGILIEDSPNNFIGGLTDAAKNVVAANRLDGILIDGPQSTGNNVLGNWIGFNVANTLESLVIPNQGDGIHITSSNNTIGGTLGGAQNTIDNNLQHGIELTGAGASGNIIQGNVIGLNPGSGSDFGNTLDGIHIDGAPNNVIGGSTPGARNVISGNNNGVVILNAGATGNLVQGNFIGTAADGVTQVGNAVNGVIINNAPRNVIGGAASGAGNVISGNDRGVVITGAGALGDQVLGNFIGTDLAAQVNIGNKRDGVLITAGASNDPVGGTAAGMGNAIAFNVGDGVLVDATAGVDNAILSNSISSNHGLGIDLGGDGVTPNHPGGSSTGPNDFQNYPILTAASPAGSITNVQGTFNARPRTSYTIQFFSGATKDPSGFGQGATFVGSTTVTTDASGNASFSAGTNVAVASGQFVTATATDPDGNTSEFSNAVPSVPVVVQFSTTSYTVDENAGTATITIVRNAAAAGGQVQVTFATGDGTAKAGTNYTATTGPVIFNPGETSKTVTIPILDTVPLTGNVTINLFLGAPTGGATLGATSTATLTIVKLNQPGTLQFSATAYGAIAGTGTGTARITVVRTGGTGLPVSVAYAAGGGTAQPGVQYTPVLGTLNFGPNDTSETFTVPILKGGPAGNVTVGLVLGNPGGGALLGASAAATLTIVEPATGSTIAPSNGGLAPPSTAAPSGGGPGPVVVAVQPAVGARGITSIAIKFNEALNPGPAQYVGNYGYFVISAGRDGVLGTTDDGATAIRSVSYNASTSTVTVVPASPLPRNGLYRIVINRGASASLGTGLTDTSGNLLSGDGSGTPGGAYLAQFGTATPTGRTARQVVARPARPSHATTIRAHAVPTRRLHP